MLQVEQADLYYGASQTLRKVNLRAAIGSVTFLLRRNGVGKTSLLRAIVGQQPLHEGSIHWAGKDITNWPAWQESTLWNYLRTPKTRNFSTTHS